MTASGSVSLIPSSDIQAPLELNTRAFSLNMTVFKSYKTETGNLLYYNEVF